MTVKDLAAVSPGLIGISGDTRVAVKCLCADTRRTDQMDGSLFFCVSGATFDGHRFAEKALKLGAKALVVERPLLSLDIPQIQVENARIAMAHMAAAFFGYPAQKMRMLAITGTKGKTTSTYLVKSIMEKMGIESGGEVYFYEEGGRFVIHNSDRDPLDVIQEAFRGEAEKVGWKTEEDVVNYIKELRKEDDFSQCESCLMRIF